MLTTWTYDRAKADHWFNPEDPDIYGVQMVRHERPTLSGYVQDKIFISDKWELTPSLRYVRYGAADVTYVDMDTDEYTSVHIGSAHALTPSLNTQYAFDDKTSAYFGWSHVYRPIKVEDHWDPYDNVFSRLRDEKGDVWTLGMRRELSPKTTAAVNYDYTRMSNAVVSYPVWNEDYQEYAVGVNARELKKSFNVSVQHQFNKHLTLNANYSHAFDEYSAKNGLKFKSGLTVNEGNINSVINKLRPANVYIADLAYENRRLYTSLAATWYTGSNTTAYTSSRALILDLNVNYAVTDDMTVYASVTNLTNQAYQTLYTRYMGKNAWPQPGRAVIFGVKYKF